jgi:suppressor for copper-sensitivity B
MSNGGSRTRHRIMDRAGGGAAGRAVPNILRLACAARYLTVIAMANLLWEAAQIPLYTIWRTGTPSEIAVAIIHCTAGDVLIAGLTMGSAWALFTGLRRDAGWRLAAAGTLLGVSYTVFSEWMNVEVRHSWTYADSMPRLPPLATGLTPLLQWLVLPPLAFLLAARRRTLVVAFVTVSIALAAAAPDHALAAASGWVGDDHAEARLVTAAEAAGGGPMVDAGLEIWMAPGWHTYWRTPGDAGIPTTFDWAGSENLAAATIAWPAPTRLTLQGLENYVYMDRVMLPIAVQLAEPGKPALLRASVDYAACAEICVPYHADLALDLPAGLAVPGPETALIAAARARVPGTLDAAGLALESATVTATMPASGAATLTIRLRSAGTPPRTPELFVEGLHRGSASRPQVVVTGEGRLTTLISHVSGVAASEIAGANLTFTLADGPDRSAEFVAAPIATFAGGFAAPSLLWMLAIALLGGLVLNLMPCVLPVLSLKLLGVARLAGADRRAMRLSLLATAVGVLACFALLASALIALKAAGAAIGWGIQFQQPWFLAGMALITMLFAASLWDWLAIDLPNAISGIAQREIRHPLANAFLTGAFATLLATPCSAPFVGTAIGFALSRGPMEIAAVFAALGVGLSSPYLLFAAAPGLVRLLPRPGVWIVWLRRALGLALLGTAIWLVAVLADETGTAVAVATGTLLIMSLVALGGRSLVAAPALLRRTAGSLALLTSAAALILPELAARPAIPVHSTEASWRPFDIAEVRRAVADGKVVFVDVTAAWCLTCKVNEAAVLDRAPVADRLHGAGVLAMRADWTRPDPVIGAYLQSFGRYGIPLDVVYGPGSPDGDALPELLTQSMVIDALDRAGRPPPGVAKR